MRPTLPRRTRIRTYRSSIASSAPVQRAIRAAYYRGGTSRAVIIHPQDLPSDLRVWPSIFRQLMGAGDPYGRQLDGMGAGISSLSKICLVESYAQDRNRATGTNAGTKQAKISTVDNGVWNDHREAHVDYTFVGLGIENDEVDVAGNCGNMSSAIGPYAYNARLLPREMYRKADGEVTVKIRNTNTGKFIDSTFSVVRRQASAGGHYAIDGVAGTSSKIKLDFRYPYGSKTGKVLPTGKRVDIICGIRATCVDGANPAVFVRADDVGIDGTILPNDFNKLPEKLELLERVRVSAAVAMGIAEDEAKVPRTIPKIGLVSMSSTHPVLSGSTLKTSQVDLVVRFISDTQPHRAIPLTAALTTAVAARIPGTVVEQLLAPDPVVNDAITIGHASGRIQVNASMDPKNPTIPFAATVYRTAKRLFEGNMFWIPHIEPVEGRTGKSRKRRSLGMAFVEAARESRNVNPLETMVGQPEKAPHPQHTATPVHERHSGFSVKSQPQHAAELAIPRLELKTSDQPSEGLSPSTFGPCPSIRSETSELTQALQNQYLYHGPVSVQASDPNTRESAFTGCTRTPPSSNFPEPGKFSRRLSGKSHIAQWSLPHRGEESGHSIASDGHNEQYVGAGGVPASHPSANLSAPRPDSSAQTLARQITSVKHELRGLQMRLNTLVTAYDQLHPTPSGSEVPVQAASAEVPQNHDASGLATKANKRGYFIMHFDRRKARSKNKMRDEKEMLNTTRKSGRWRLSTAQNLFDEDKRVAGRKW